MYSRSPLFGSGISDEEFAGVPDGKKTKNKKEFRNPKYDVIKTQANRHLSSASSNLKRNYVDLHKTHENIH